MKIAITGHTERLGKAFFNELSLLGHDVQGFSRRSGYDLRDYSKVSLMLAQIKEFDVFINNAKPDFAQSQILYRLVRQWNNKTIINIGSGALETTPNWTDTFLLEYLTQKSALQHAVNVLSKMSTCNIILLNPPHINNCTQYVNDTIRDLNLWN